MAAAQLVPPSSQVMRGDFVIASKADGAHARLAARRLACEMGFAEAAQEEVALAVSELAANIVVHARRGRLQLSEVPGTLWVVASDSGPGIEDVDAVVQDGVSTAGSLGYGLGAVTRAMDEVQIISRPRQGTSVVASRTLDQAELTGARAVLDVAAASRPKVGLDDNGDAHAVVWGTHEVLVGVIDGLGHGPAAAEASAAALRHLETHAGRSLGELFAGVAAACRSTRGVVMALARIDTASSTLEVASVGNIDVKLMGAPDKLALVVRRGVLGLNAPAPRVTKQAWAPEAMLVMFSDGLPSRWVMDDERKMRSAPALTMAHELLHRFGRDHDDATVLVVKNRR